MQYSYDNYFSLSDILSALSWLIILSVFVFYKSSKLETKRLSRLYILNFYFKVVFGLAFAVYYIVVVNGGDTLAYWDGGKSIQDLLIADPFKGIEHLYTAPTRLNYYSFFQGGLERPPSWIYKEPESYFVSKVVSILGFLTLKSYLATTFIFGFIVSNANWKIFQLADNTKLFQQKFISIAFLFIPSVAFWCSGISKDTLVLVSIFYILYYLFKLAKKTSTQPWIDLLSMLFFVFIIYEIRSFMLVVIIIPTIAYLLVKMIHRLALSSLNKIALNLTIVILFIGITSVIITSSSAANLIQNNSTLSQAIIVQQDFMHNETYSKNQYDLGDLDLTPKGILSAMPISIFSGIFQPLPWNGLSISLFLNAIESSILIILFLKLFFTRNLIKWINAIRKNELLVFCLTFVLLFAFIAGFTSIIFGVLVRLRAPLLPFIFALLVITLEKKQLLHEKD